MTQSMERYKIGKVAYLGKSYDFTNLGYEIDDSLQVFKNGQRIAENDGHVNLRHTLSGNGKKGKKNFGLTRLFLAVVSPLPPDIEKASGIRVINYDLPIGSGRRNAYETPSDRVALQRHLRAVLGAMPEDVWKILEYNEKEFNKYLISEKTGVIRGKDSPGKPNRPTKIVRVTLYDDAGNRVTLYVHVAYMQTFRSANRRPDQCEVDHIDGNHKNNAPNNLRWASSSENKNYIFTPMKPRRILDKFMGDLNSLTKFGNLYFGGVDGKFSIVGPFRRIRRVGDFDVTDRSPYPLIGFGSKVVQVHKLVAYVYGKITKNHFENTSDDNQVVMHLNNEKHDFHPDNLKSGTYTENNTARHANPATTSRKRTRQLDLQKNLVAEFESRTTAAVVVGVSQYKINKAITQGLECNGYLFESM